MSILDPERRTCPRGKRAFFPAELDFGEARWDLVGGSDDIEAAYRRVMCAWPQLLWLPCGKFEPTCGPRGGHHWDRR